MCRWNLSARLLDGAIAVRVLSFRIKFEFILFCSIAHYCCCCCYWAIAAAAALVYGLNGIFMQTNHKLNIVLIIPSMYASVCIFILRFKWLNYANNENSHTRPPHTHIPFCMHMICDVAINCGVTCNSKTKWNAVILDGIGANLQSILWWVVSVTVWIAWQLNCNMPKVNVKHQAEGDSLYNTATSRKWTDFLLTQFTHYQHCKSNWLWWFACFDTIHFPLILFNMENTHDRNKINRTHTITITIKTNARLRRYINKFIRCVRDVRWSLNQCLIHNLFLWTKLKNLFWSHSINIIIKFSWHFLMVTLAAQLDWDWPTHFFSSLYYENVSAYFDFYFI